MTDIVRARFTHAPPGPEDLAGIAAIAEAEAGLSIGETKASMVQSRLAGRLRKLGLPDFGAYLTLLRSDAGAAERREMISALTTNVSHFFREMHHFELLRTQVLPELAVRARAGKRIRLWSAGCSRGQEPYSMAMTLLEVMPDAPDHDIRILATDIDRAVLQDATAGEYDEAALAPVSAEQKHKYFERHAERWAIGPGPRRLVRFRPLNLHADWPMRGAFDVIFCRNVVIYFAPARQEVLWQRFCRALSPGGWLFVGHSERVSPAAGLAPRGVTAYRRSGRGE